MEKQYRPQVTVAVLTYNSSKTVLQTLESIKAQSYDNLRLIVSDDCTVRWLFWKEHRHYNNDGYYRKQHTTHYAYGKAIPEWGFLTIKQERYKAKDRTQYG